MNCYTAVVYCQINYAKERACGLHIGQLTEILTSAALHCGSKGMSLDQTAIILVELLFLKHCQPVCGAASDIQLAMYT